jgi:hypothetical protein
VRDGWERGERIAVESWALVHLARDRVTGFQARLHEVFFPLAGEWDLAELEDAAYAELARAASARARLSHPGLACWLEVGHEAVGGYAVGELAPGVTARDGWARAARTRPHGLRFAWNDLQSTADHPYRISRHDPSTGEWTHEDRRGPWSVDDPLPDHLTADRRHAAFVDDPPVGPELAFHVVAEAALALQHAHDCGFVHGALGPRSLVLRDDGQVVVTGLAAWAAERRMASYTGSGSPEAYFARLAPEVLRDMSDPSPRADVFGLGRLLFELTTFTSAFMRACCYDTIEAVLACDLAAPTASHPALPADIDRIVLRACATAPENRYPDAATLATELRTLYDPGWQREQLATFAREMARCGPNGDGALPL